MTGDEIYIYGKHAVKEAVSYRKDAVRRVFKLATFDDAEVLSALKKSGVPVSTALPQEIDSHVGRDAVHQGITALIDTSMLLTSFEEFIPTLPIDKRPALVLLGELNDPHNVGAIIRSATAFGISGVLIPEHRQAPITGAVVKASVGMAFRIPLITVGNANQTILSLKEKGFWVYGLSAEGEQVLSKEKFTEASLFVIGNEGRGIRTKTEEHCDIMLRIPIDKAAESLNASVSAAIVFYQWYAGR